MDDIDQILADNGLNRDNLEAALELARLVSAETGICCTELGKFTFACLHRLDGEEEEEE